MPKCFCSIVSLFFPTTSYLSRPDLLEPQSTYCAKIDFDCRKTVTGYSHSHRREQSQQEAVDGNCTETRLPVTMKEGRNTSMHNPTSTTTGIGVTNTTTNSCIPNSSNSPCCWSSCNHLVANSQIIHLPVRCFKCKQVIREAHLLLADEQYWHEDCLRCVCCEVRLAELDKHFYVKADMPLCRRDYLRWVGKPVERLWPLVQIKIGIYSTNVVNSMKISIRVWFSRTMLNDSDNNFVK